MKIERAELANLTVTGTIYRKEALPPKQPAEGEVAPDTQEVEYSETTNRVQNSHLINSYSIASLDELYRSLSKSAALTGDQLALHTVLVAIKEALKQHNDNTDPQLPLPTLNVIYADDVGANKDVDWTIVWKSDFCDMVVVNFPTISNQLDPVSGSTESRTYSISIASNVPVIGA